MNHNFDSTTHKKMKKSIFLKPEYVTYKHTPQDVHIRSCVLFPQIGPN